MFDDNTSAVTGKAETSGSIVDAGAIAADHPPTQEPRKKRGRPRKTVETDTEQSPGVDQQKSVGGGVALSPETRQQVICSVQSLFGIIDSRAQRLVEKTAERITGDKGFAQGLAEDVAMTPTEKETISTLTVVVIEKYNLLGTYAPEAMLGIALVGYGYRVHSTLADLKKLARLQNDNGLPSPSKPTIDNGQKRDGKE
jgi:hypothetical protein